MGAADLDGADQLAAVGLDHRDRVDAGGAQRDPPGGELVGARRVAPAALAQAPERDEPLGVGLPARAERVGVVGRQRQLVRGREQVLHVDLLGLVVEDRLLDGAVEELVGVAAEELVERVVAGDVDRQAGGAAARAAPHLAQARDRAGEGDADRGVEVADVDPQLERVGRDDREQVALGQAPLDLAPLRGRVAGAVGRDPLREVAAAGVLEPQLREALDQLDAAARLQEADRPHARLHQLGQELRGLRQRRAADAGVLVDQRRVPHHDLALGVRRAVAVDQLEVEPGQPLAELERVGDRRAGQHEARLGAVSARQAPQPAQHVRHVRAEHAAVDVRLVDHDPSQVREHVAPVAVVGQDADVEHVGVREDQVRAPADRAALLLRRVAVVDRVAQERGAQLVELARLVLGERLRRDRGRARARGGRARACRARAG